MDGITSKRIARRETRRDVASAIEGAFHEGTPVTAGQLLTEAAHRGAGRAVMKALHTLPTDRRYRGLGDAVESIDSEGRYDEAGRAR